MYYFISILPALALVNNPLYWIIHGALALWWNGGDTTVGVPLSALWLLAIHVGIAAIVSLVIRNMNDKPLFGKVEWNTPSVFYGILFSLVLLIGEYGYFHAVELTGSSLPLDLFPLGRYRCFSILVLLCIALYTFDHKWRAVTMLAPDFLHLARTTADDMALFPMAVALSLAILLDIALRQAWYLTLDLVAVGGGSWLLFVLFSAPWVASYDNRVSSADNAGITAVAADTAAALFDTDDVEIAHRKDN